jgi:cell division transport system permease protein
VPRLVVVTIDESSPPDFQAMRARLAAEIPQATLDDHRNWVDRLVTMARTMITFGIAILGLMLSATVLTVVFATRGAMTGNEHIIEVLHFVGAEARFIALEFRRHFLKVGMKGASVGGLAAIVVFLAIGWWSSRNLATPEADQAAALFGRFAIGAAAYGWIVAIVMLIAGLTVLTTHFTVVSRLDELDAGQGDNG